MSSRYAKQEKLVKIGPEGRETIAGAKVLVIGGGALGSSAVDTLARAGIGHITVIDADRVEESNLHRTALFDENDVGEYKAEVLGKKLSDVNRGLRMTGLVLRVVSSNIEQFMDTDIVVDGTDNLETRLLINDACIKHGIPWVYAGVLATSGNVMLIRPEGPTTTIYGVCERTGVKNPTRMRGWHPESG